MFAASASAASRFSGAQNEAQFPPSAATPCDGDVRPLTAATRGWMFWTPRRSARALPDAISGRHVCSP